MKAETKSNEDNSIPTLYASDIALGRYLQNGSLSDVIEISSFTKETSQSDTTSALNKRSSRYVIKRLRQCVIDDPETKPLAMKTLQKEVKVLSTLQHPNIIQLRGKVIPKDNEDSDAIEGLILQKLYTTLNKRLSVWLEQKKHLNKLSYRVLALASKKIEKKRCEKKFNLFYHRLCAACDLSSAIQYLHQKRIIHRDIKPGNIGFDIRGKIVLFDFGSSHVLPPLSPSESTTNETKNRCVYKLTKRVGTFRYMAPEVALGKPYNELCDVYSFSLVLWEIFTLCEHQKRVYEDIHTEKSFYEMVFNKGKHGRRPPLTFFENELSTSLASMLSGGWEYDPNLRLTSNDMHTILCDEKDKVLTHKKTYFHEEGNSYFPGTSRHSAISECLENSRHSIQYGLTRIGNS